MSKVSDAELARFVRHEARLIDEKRFDEWYGLFTDDGYYWVPAVHGQKSPLTENSLAYEDKLLLQLRLERLKSPSPTRRSPPAAPCTCYRNRTSKNATTPKASSSRARLSCTRRRRATIRNATLRPHGIRSSGRTIACA